MFYDTCIPECATDEDSYHTERDMCMVTDGVLVTYLNGDGQKCGKGTVGEQAIRTATASLSNHHRQGRYWYKADAAGRVRALLESCRGTCAKGDPTLHDNVHCQVMGLDRCTSGSRSRGGERSRGRRECCVLWDCTVVWEHARFPENLHASLRGKLCTQAVCLDLPFPMLLTACDGQRISSAAHQWPPSLPADLRLCRR